MPRRGLDGAGPFGMHRGPDALGVAASTTAANVFAGGVGPPTYAVALTSRAPMRPRGSATASAASSPSRIFRDLPGGGQARSLGSPHLARSGNAPAIVIHGSRATGSRARSRNPATRSGTPPRSHIRCDATGPDRAGVGQVGVHVRVGEAGQQRARQPPHDRRGRRPVRRSR